MKSKEKFFTRVVANTIIGAVIIGIIAIAFMPTVIDAYGRNTNGAYYSGDANSASVALMVNVYGGQEYIDDMLGILDEYDAKVTFFVGGIWAEKNEEMLKRMSEKGHEIGNHGYLHRDHKKINDARNREEMTITSSLIEKILGKAPTLFAPPSGAVEKRIVDIATSVGMDTIMWTLDTIDWRDQDKKLIVSRATSKLKAGDFVLMHPTLATKNSLEEVLTIIKGKNLKCVNVSQLL